MGSGTAVFVCGTCFAPGARITEPVLLVDGEEQPVAAHGMPRLDLMRATGEPAAYRAGFWGLARIAAREGGSALDLRLRARLEGGGVLEEELALIPVAALPEPVPGSPLVAICMATYEPPDRRCSGARSSRSARRPHRDWVCVISDDCSRARALRGDARRWSATTRASSSRAPRDRRGFYAQLRARAGAGAGRRRATSPWPTRTTPGTRTSSRRCSARSAARSSSTATSGSSTATATLAGRHLLGERRATTTPTCSRC